MTWLGDRFREIWRGNVVAIQAMAEHPGITIMGLISVALWANLLLR